MDGLRSFFEMDNHSALDVGHLRKGQRPFKVQKPKFSEDSPEASREGADDLTLRAEEVNTLKACITEENRWEPPAGGCGLARFLPSKLQRNWREWVGRAVFSLQMDE